MNGRCGSGRDFDRRLGVDCLPIHGDSFRQAASRLVRAATPQEARLLDRAEHVLVRRCMARHDFKVWIAGKPWPRAPEFPYVVDDVGWASRHGYGSDIERRLEELKKADPNQRYVVRLSPQRQKAYSRALHGEHPGSPANMTATVPTGGVVGASNRGCIAEAQREVYGDLAGWFRANTVTNNLAGTRAGLVTQDPQFLGTLRRWSRCMHAGGYPYANPGEARAAVPTVKRRRTPKARDPRSGCRGDVRGAHRPGGHGQKIGPPLRSRSTQTVPTGRCNQASHGTRGAASRPCSHRV